MGYANPKPRTILKDFKIFEWENLERGMRKVLQRYHPKVGGQSAVEPIPGRRRHARSSVSVQAGSWRGGGGTGSDGGGAAADAVFAAVWGIRRT
jgi:hypothetical protein